MTDVSKALSALFPQGSPAEEVVLAHLIAAWESGAAIPRLADKTITPMAGARVDLERLTFCE